MQIKSNKKIIHNYFYQGVNPTVDIIVVNHQHEVLMVKRSSLSAACPGMLAFPGGFIDSKSPRNSLWVEDVESPEMAALRELKEETNLNLSSYVKLIWVGSYEGGSRDPRDTSYSWTKTYAYLFKLNKKIYDQQKKNIRGMDDADEASWIEIDDLLNKELAFDHNEILLDVLKYL